MITLTEKAAKEIASTIQRRNEEAEGSGEKPRPLYLRVGMKGGGCSGLSYTLDLADVRADSDEAWEQHGVTVICDPKSLLYLDGTTVDYRDDLMQRGFVFNNPNATGCCGCGESFSA